MSSLLLICVLPRAAASLNASDSQYLMAIGPVTGSTSANYVYFSVFNPVGSGKNILITHLFIRNNAVGTATYQSLTLRRITAASGGTLTAASDIPKKNTYSASAIAEVRYAGAAVTYANGVNSRIMSVVEPGAAGSLNGFKELEFNGAVNDSTNGTIPLILHPGEGVALYQEAAGSTNQRITLLVEWDETNTTIPIMNEYIIATPRVSNAAGTNYVYQTFFNPLTSGKTFIVRRIDLDVDCNGAARYTNTIALRRITAASGGTLIAQSDIPEKNTAGNASSAELRNTGVTVAFVGTSYARLREVTPCGAANQHGAHKETLFGSNEEPLILKSGEGVALISEATGDVNQLPNMQLEWDEIPSANTPAAGNELMYASPPVTIAATANYVYESIFNPVSSGKIAIIKRIEIRQDASGNNGVYQAVNLQRITAASGGTLVSQSDIMKKNTATNTTLMELRYAGPTVTFSGGTDAIILSMTGQGNVGQLHSRKELVFSNTESIILRPGEGLAMYSGAAGGSSQISKMYVDWEEEPLAAVPATKNEYAINIGPITGVTTSGYRYASFFNPSLSNVTAVIKKIFMDVDTNGAALYIPFSILRTTAASGGTNLVAASDIPKKNTASNMSLMEWRYGNPTITAVGSSAARVESTQSPAALGTAVAPQLTGWQDDIFLGESYIIRPGEGLALYQEAAGDVNFLVEYMLVWQEIPVLSTPASGGDYMISVGPVTGSTASNYVYATIYNPLDSNRDYLMKRIDIRADRTGASSAPNYIPVSLQRINASTGGTLMSTADILAKNAVTNATTAELRYAGPTVSFIGSAVGDMAGVTAPGAVGQEYGKYGLISTPGNEIIIHPGEGLAMYQQGTAGDINMRYRMDVVWNESIIDAIPPKINFTYPTDANNTTMSRTWSYINITTDENASQCILSFGTTNFTMNAASGSLTNWYYNDTGIPDGTYTYMVICNDTAGNIGYSETRYIFIDATPPAVTNVVPGAGTTFNFSTNITLSAMVADPHGVGTVFAQVTYPNATQQLLQLMSVSGSVYNASFSIPVLVGRYNVSFSANDTLGNTNATTATYFVVQDLVPPAVFSLLSPPSGTVSTNLQPALSWQETADADFKNYTILIATDPAFNNITARLTTVSLTNTSIAVSPALSADAHYYWRVIAYDNSLNSQNATADFSYTTDTTSPVVTLNAPNNLTYVLTSAVLFNYTPFDLTLQNCSLYGNFSGNFALDQSNVTPTNNQSNYFSRTLTDGEYLWSVQCIDKIGHFSFAAANFTLLVDTAPPLINLEDPLNGSSVTTSNNVTLYYNTTDAMATISSCSLQINGSVIATNTSITQGVTQHFTVLLSNAVYTWNVNCTDANGFTGSSPVYAVNVHVPTAPMITILSPADMTGDNDGNLSLVFNVSNDWAITNCSLLLNGVVNTTNSVITKNIPQTFAVDQLAAGRYYWGVNCTNDQSLQGNSSLQYVDIILTSAFSGSTTNLSLQASDAIANLTLENPATGKIRYALPINLSGGADLTAIVKLSTNVINVDTATEQRLNKSATLSFYNLPYQFMPVLYADGIICTDCTAVSYVAGTAVFNVSHFTNYTTGSNARLSIWDESDPLGGSKIIFLGNTTAFYANYTNTTSQQPFSSASCTIMFADLNTTMNYNATLQLYTYQRNFTQAGYYPWSVLCNGSSVAADSLNVTDGIQVYSDAIIAVAPVYPVSNINVSYGALFNYTVNISCTKGFCGNVSAFLDPTNWLDPGWPYKQSITLAVAAGSIPSGYQAKILLTNTTVASHWNWSNECINTSGSPDTRARISNAADTAELSYWVENCSTIGQSMTIWVKIDQLINTTMNYTFNIYYGNSTAVGMSNGSAVFDFFDDFSGGLGKWSVHQSSGVYPRVEGGVLVAGGGSTVSPYGHTSLGSDATYGLFQDGVIDGDVYLNVNAIGEVGFRGDFVLNTGYKSRMDARSGQGLSHLMPPYNGWNFVPGCVVTGTAPPINQWLNFSIIVTGNIFNITTGGQTKVCTDSTYASAGEISLQNHYGNATLYDNIRVRKYSAVNPVVSYGSEAHMGEKGVIPMNTGLPFYTLGNNPFNLSTMTCLSNMNLNDSCVLNWVVNSTGNPSTPWTFFVIANSSITANQSSSIIITIVNDTIPPALTAASINTTSINQSETVRLNVTITDQTPVMWATATLQYPNNTLINYSLAPSGSGDIWSTIFSDTNTTGTYTITRIIAVDQAGNMNNTAFSTIAFNVTPSPPAPFSLLNPANGTESASLTPTLAWQQTTDATFANYTILLSTANNFSTIAFMYNTFTMTNTTKLLDYALNANVHYYWRIVAYDVFGSSTNATSDYEYITDTLAPTVDLMTPANTFSVLTTQVAFNYTPHDANTLDHCTLYGNFSGFWSSNQTNITIAKDQQNHFVVTLSDGKYLWNVLCFDKAGNNGLATANYTLTVDTTPPIVQLMSPQNATLENNTNNEAFWANATDAMSGISSCTLIIDGAAVQTKSGITNGIPFNMTNFVSNGNHTWSMNCTDTNGFTGQSAIYNLTLDVVDHDPPIILINAPAPQTYLSSGIIAFNYTPQDATGIANCSLYIDGTANSTNTTVTVFAPNIIVADGVTEGYHNWTITCYDNSTQYNRGVSQTNNLTVDLTNPTVVLTTPSNNSFINSNTVNFSFIPNDTNLYRCILYGNFTGLFGPNISITNPFNGIENTLALYLADGTYLWNIQCLDAAGRSSFAATNYTITVDTIPPAYTAIAVSPLSPTIYNSGQTYQFNSSWIDNYAVDTVLLEQNFSGMMQNSTAQYMGNGVYEINRTGLAAGNYSYRWYANDSLNNVNNTPQYYYEVQQAYPIINLYLNGTTANISTAEGGLINITASLTAPATGYITLSINGVIINNGSAPLTNLTLFTTPGLYTVTAYYPATQNYTTGNATYSVHVNDTTPPNVTLQFPANASIVGIATVTFQYLVQDASAIANCSLLIGGTINQTDTNVTRNVTQTFSIYLPDGNYTWSVQCADSYANIRRSEERNLTVRQTTNMTLTVSAGNITYEQGSPVTITVTTKDLYGTPLSADTRTAIIYLNTTITTIPWWNGSWPYRNFINITETNNTNLTNYQVNVSLNTSQLIAAGKLLADCSDLRFTDDTAVEIPYYTESGCNTTNTQVWLKLNLTGNKSKTIVVYYGNPSATAVSNGSRIFNYYDSGDQLASWSLVGTTGQSAVQGMPAPSYYATSVNGNYLYRNVSLAINSVVEFNVRSDGLGNFYFLANSAGAGQHFRAETRAGNNAGIGAAASWTSWSVPSQTCSNLATNTWYSFKLIILSTTAQAYINNTVCGSAYTFTNNGPYIGLIGDALGASYTTWWDNLRIRAYAAQEPSARTMQNEQQLLQWNTNTTNIIDGTSHFLFDSKNQPYGNYSVVAIANLTGFFDAMNATYFTLIPDTTPPTVTLLAPSNLAQAGSGYFNFTYLPFDYNLKNCTLYIDRNGTFLPNVSDQNPQNNATNMFQNIYLGIGLYTWNVRCYDVQGNAAYALSNFTLNITLPDLSITASAILFGNTSTPVESETIPIYANISNIGLSGINQSFIVAFYHTDPSINGSQIGQNITVSGLAAGSTVQVNTSYDLTAGTNKIVVVLDVSSMINETSKANNNATNSIIVGMYQYYYGNISNTIVLSTAQNNTFRSVIDANITSGIIFIADSDSSFQFGNLQSLGRNILNSTVNNDFAELDSILGSTNNTDSIDQIWTNNTDVPSQTDIFTILGRDISNVPIINSTDNGNFETGIFWDTADDYSVNYQYDIIDHEDIVFATKINPRKPGRYGTYDYEIRVPAALRSYTGLTNTVAFYYEIK